MAPKEYMQIKLKSASAKSLASFEQVKTDARHRKTGKTARTETKTNEETKKGEK